jgi:uncharacterized protein YciI
VPERYALLHYDYVPDVLERRAPHRDAHLEHIRAWKEDGRVVLAGAVGDPPHGALFVLRDAADASAFVEADPYARNGLVTDWRVDAWMVV